jgi:hypothetical protein
MLYIRNDDATVIAMITTKNITQNIQIARLS